MKREDRPGYYDRRAARRPFEVLVSLVCLAAALLLILAFGGHR